MPIINTPSGPIMVDDGATPDVIRKIVAQHSSAPAVQAATAATAAQAPKPSAEQQEVQRRVAVQQKGPHFGLPDWIDRKVMQGLTFNHMDELNGAVGAATTGVVNAVKNRNIGEIGKEYRISRDVERTKDAQDNTHTGSTMAEIAGALMNPIGDGAKALQFAGKAVPMLGRIGTKIASAPALIRGVLAGGNQGALNAEGSDDSATGVGDLANRMGQGYITGAGMGGIFGGTGVGAKRVTQILADRAPQAAERMAASRIGKMLTNAKIMPGAAEREIAATNASGGDAVLADLTPGLQGQAGALAKKPNVPGSNDMIARSRQRLDDRNARFENEVQSRIQLANGNDAAAHMANLTATRKGAGNIDYQQALDGKFHWDQNLQDFMDKADPEMHDAMRQGAHLASMNGQDVGQLGMKINPLTGMPEMHTTPSMRVFDYAKKAMDDKIGEAMRANKPGRAAGLSNLLGTFKQHIMNANPDYAPALAKQRDFFQRHDATASGIDFVNRLRNSNPLKGPQSILKEIDSIRATDPAHLEDVRTGMANSILAMSSKADPRAFIQQSMKNADQKKVMEFVFGGPKPLAEFTKWMDREARSTETDKFVAPGYQSATELFKQAGDSLGSDVGGLATKTFRGFGFGGLTGGGGNFLAGLDNLKNNLSPHALDAMAKALMSDGQGIAGKVAAAEKFSAARKAGNAKLAIRLGKVGQQRITDFTGN